MFTTKVIKGNGLAITCHVGMFKIIAIHAATDFYANNLLRRYTVYYTITCNSLYRHLRDR